MVSSTETAPASETEETVVDPDADLKQAGVSKEDFEAMTGDQRQRVLKSVVLGGLDD